MRRVLALLCALSGTASAAPSLGPLQLPDPLPRAAEACELVLREGGSGWCRPEEMVYRCPRGVALVILRELRGDGTCIETRVYYPPGTMKED